MATSFVGLYDSDSDATGRQPVRPRESCRAAGEKDAGQVVTFEEAVALDGARRHHDATRSSQNEPLRRIDGNERALVDPDRRRMFEHRHVGPSA
jgi:hypothetical protein